LGRVVIEENPKDCSMTAHLAEVYGAEVSKATITTK
jgi:hypothetical protein